MKKLLGGVASIGYSFWYNKAIKSEGNKDKTSQKTKKYFDWQNARKEYHYVYF